VAVSSPPRPTLLVVDDDRAVRELVRSVGERAAFDVTVCADGTEALAELRQHHYDVAAIDLCMPGTGGLDVLRAMRTADLDCQVILMSGGATIDNAVEAIKLGAVDFLTKPLDLERFLQLLEPCATRSAAASTCSRRRAARRRTRSSAA
jgi:DNA-binding NtrC family response regulator